MSEAIITIENEADFDAVVQRSSLPTVVGFTAAWCTPCRRQLKVLKDLAAKYGNRVQIVLVDIGAAGKLRMRFDVEGIPSLLLFRAGKMLGRLTGLTSLGDLERGLGY